MAYLGRVKPTETTSSVLRSTYTGNGSTTTYALPGPVANETSIIATINGVTQQDAAYSTDGSNIIFSAAPALGDSIELRTLSAVAMSYAPSAGSVVTGVIADGAVTTAKINDASVTGAKLGTGAAVANIGARAITAGQVPAGTVLQVVQSYTATQVSTTSTTYVSTGFAATITPTSSTSKILILGSAIIRLPSANNNYQHTIYRGATNLAPVAFRGFIQCRSGDMDMTPAFQYLDSPATTSATTYTWYHKSEAGGVAYFAIDGSYAQITLMEIAQ